jgi:oligoendopeptidase F
MKAQGVRWDLSPVHRDAAEARAALASHLSDAAQLQKKYLGRVATLGPHSLAGMLMELGSLTARARATTWYCRLRSLADSQLPENQDLEAAADQAGLEFANLTRFFELEWKALPEAEALTLARSPQLQGDRYLLERFTDQAAHTLSTEREAALAARATAAESAWQQLFNQAISAITAEFAPDGEDPRPHTIPELRAHLFDGRSGVRRRALETL